MNNSYFFTLLNLQHICHPFTLPAKKNTGLSSYIKINEAVTAVACGVLAILSAMRFNQFAAVGAGCVVFYTITAFFKSKSSTRKCQKAWDHLSFSKQPSQELAKKEFAKLKLTQPQVEEDLNHILEEDVLVSEKSIQPQKDLSVEENTEKQLIAKKQEKALETAKKKIEKRNENLLNKLFQSQTSFFENVKEIHNLFLVLKDHYPKESIIIEYEKALSESLVHFNQFYQALRLTYENSSLKASDRIQQIATLYRSDKAQESYDSLSSLILLHHQFEDWGGEDRYEKLATDLFDQEILVDLHSQYSPILFNEYLPQLQEMMQELAQNVSSHGSHIQDTQTYLKTISEAIEEKKRKAEDLAAARKSENQKKREHILREVFHIETSFLKNAKKIREIFAELTKKHPSDPLLTKYEAALTKGIVNFDSFYKELDEIYKNSILKELDKIERIAALYRSKEAKIQYQSLLSLILLYPYFQEWGTEEKADAKYEKLVKDLAKFDSHVIIELSGIYSPIIFVQHLPRIELLMQEIGKHAPNSHISMIQETQVFIKKVIKEINEKKREAEQEALIAKVDVLLKQLAHAKHKHSPLIQKQAVQLYIENRLYIGVPFDHDPRMQQIKQCYSCVFQDIFPDLFKKIDKLKRKASSLPTQTKIVEQELSDSKEILIRYLEYLSLDHAGPLNGVGFERWQEIGNSLLDKNNLTYENLKSWIKKYNLDSVEYVKCLSKFLIRLKKESNDTSTAQEIVDLMEDNIKKLATFKDMLSPEKRNKRKQIADILEELKDAIAEADD